MLCMDVELTFSMNETIICVVKNENHFAVFISSQYCTLLNAF